jgi:hypothetical protein
MTMEKTPVLKDVQRPSWAASLVTLAALGAALAGCGGGGNESGPADALFVSPAEVSVGSTGTCAVGLGPTVFIYGGQPPYKLDNSVPQAMLLDKSVVQRSGDGFTISFINGICLDSMPIIVEDDLGRTATVSVSNGA